MSILETADSVLSETAKELIDILLDFMDITKEQTVKHVLRFTCGLLNTNNSENLKLALKLIRKLIAVIIPDTKGDEVLPANNPQLVSDLLLCVDMWTGHFPEKGKFLLRQLWSRSVNNESRAESAQIVVQAFDDYLCESGAECVTSSKLFHRIQKLLESKVYEERRSAHLLLKMVVDIDSNGRQQLDLFSYIIIMECLEVNECNQKSAPMGIPLSLLKGKNNDHNWLRNLYIRLLLLQDTNIQVLGSILQFIMTHFTVAELSSANLLIEFLTATNKLELHNFEDYFLPEEQMKKFVSDIDNKQFWRAFGEVAWIGVPIHRWLDCIEPTKQPQISKKLLLKLCPLVRNLKNVYLRNSANNRLCEALEITIKSLSLGDYMAFIEALFDSSYDVCAFALYLLAKILDNCKNINQEIVHLTKSSFEKLCDNQNCDVQHPLMELLRQFEHVPKAQHGWWRLPVFFYLYMEDETVDLYSSVYDLNMEFVKECKDVKELQKYLIDKLNCNTEDKKLYVMHRSVDLFIKRHVTKWSQLEEFHLNPIDVLKNGTFDIVLNLTTLLRDHDKVLQDARVFETFLLVLKKYPTRWLTSGNILKYAIQHLDKGETENLLEDMISNSLDGWEIGGILNVTKSLPQSTIIKGLLNGESPTGDTRIEYAYLNNSWNWTLADLQKRNNFITHVSRMKEEDLYDVFNELLSINEIIIQKETLLENSTDHKTQMRIVRTFFNFESTGARLPAFWSHKLWSALFAPNNQLNIRYSYECLVAKLLLQFELLMEKLETLSSLQANQQDSIISVLHIYCVLNWESLRLEQLQKVFQLLSQQMMSTNSQTTIFNQMVLHRLAVKCEKSSMDLPIAASMKPDLELLLEDTIPEHHIEARLILPEILQNYSPANTILYMTNAPFDEYDCPKWHHSGNEMDKIEKLRSAFKSC